MRVVRRAKLTSAAIPEFNSSLSARFPLPVSNQTLLDDTDPLVCDGRNFSRSFGNFVATQNYDLGTNFPIMSIMTFFPKIPSGNTFRGDSNRVQIACLVPGQVTEGSRAKASVQDTLDRFNSTGGNEVTGAASSNDVRVWKLMAWVASMGLVFVY